MIDNILFSTCCVFSVLLGIVYVYIDAFLIAPLRIYPLKEEFVSICHYRPNISEYVSDHECNDGHVSALHVSNDVSM